MTLTGGPMTKARNHLKNLGIESLTNRPNLRELANDIRKLLSAPFANITEYYKAAIPHLGAAHDFDIASDDSEI